METSKILKAKTVYYPGSLKVGSYKGLGNFMSRIPGFDNYRIFTERKYEVQ